MKINILQAHHGDAIHISFTDASKRNRNFLIDGGPSNTYEGKRANGRTGPGPLRSLVEDIRQKGESIDLLVLSHLDADHIDGPLTWFEKDPYAHDLVKKVWFNSGRLISEHFSKPDKPERLLLFKPADSLQTSIGQGVAFENFISEKGIWERKIVKALDKVSVHGVTFTVLSPDDRSLARLEKEWRVERPDSLTTAKEDDYNLSVAEHLDADKFKEDDKIPNGSSIAFILTYKKKNLLFLADAFPSVVANSLVALGYSPEKRLKVDLIKLAHHGSKGNTSADLLKLIDCKDFIVSSNGAIFNLPNKRCLSRIIGNVEDARFHFNYGEMIDRIFTNADRSEFSGFSTLPITGAFEI